MTYNATDEDIRVEGNYAKLECSGGGPDGSKAIWVSETPYSCGCWGSGVWWWWVKLVVVGLFFGALGVVLLKWVVPFVMNKEIIPIMNWIETFNLRDLALLIFGSITIFPTLLLPSSPSMWVAGITFGYCYGFLLIIAAVSIGVSVPYLIGSLFYSRIQVWLGRYPKHASIIRLAGEGSFFSQLQAVALIRISPFPYIVYNYCAVATDVKYGPYLIGTLVGMVPEIFLTLYTGIVIQTLTNASSSSDEQAPPPVQIFCTIAGFCIAGAATAIVTLFAKRRLNELQIEEAQLLH